MDIQLFLDEKEANKFLCAICHNVLYHPAGIGCREDHIFCMNCIENLFKHEAQQHEATKRCPSCREEGLTKSGVSSRKYVERMINPLRVKCKLQFEAQENKNNDEITCDWNGEVMNLSGHISQHCPLFLMICDYCNHEKKRCEMPEHHEKCPDKLLKCDLCNHMIKRKAMNVHAAQCEMTRIRCDECDMYILRKYMVPHIEEECIEVMVECEYSAYGCDAKMKRGFLNEHLQKEQVNHLKMQVNHLKMQVSFMEDQLELIPRQSITSNNDYKGSVIMALRDEGIVCCDLKNAAAKLIKDSHPILTNHYIYCIAKNVDFTSTKSFGFDTKGINLYSNDILFGLSKTNLTVMNIGNKIEAVNYDGKLELDRFTPIYSKYYGLHMVGGENYGLRRIDFDKNATMKQVDLGKLPNPRLWPSTTLLNDKQLFIGGGWWNQKILVICDMINFETQTVTTLKKMNHSHQLGGTCVWKERGDKIVVAAGWTQSDDADNKYVEEYDVNKNVWIDLPHLNERHSSYAALLPSNNILFCIGGVDIGHTHLGCIELFDPRDTANKWIYVDTVENYFDLQGKKAAGYNCFMSV